MKTIGFENTVDGHRRQMWRVIYQEPARTDWYLTAGTVAGEQMRLRLTLSLALLTVRASMGTLGNCFFSTPSAL